MCSPSGKAKRRVVSATEDPAPGVGTAMEGAAKEARSKITRRKSGHLRRRFACFGCGADNSKRGFSLRDEKALRDGGRCSGLPTHLVVTVNGIIGSAGNWRFASKEFLKKLPDGVVVYRSRRNCNLATFDGVDVMGERLAEEILRFVRGRPELRKISFVAHSLGGLISRYAIAKLYESAPHKETCIGNDNSKDLDTPTESLEAKSMGRISGLEPMNFITFATPHLGSRWHKQVPVFCGSSVLENMASRGSWILGRTGKHLFLKDTEKDKSPLLLRMVKDTEDLPFISSLRSFVRCVAYANVCRDYVVGWKTSSIRHEYELPKRQAFIKNPKYPHIVHVQLPESTHAKQDAPLDLNKFNMQETMVNDLNKVPWERVDVCFRKSFQGLFAHNTIQVNTYWMNSQGADVIAHMIDNFRL